MFLQHKRHISAAMALLMMLSVASFGLATPNQDKKDKKAPEGTPVLWQEPADIATRNLFLGPGGEAMKPDLSKLTFIKQKQGGYSTKYVVRDGAGREWVAKIGKEAQSDTVANRLLWAVGYFTEIAYLVPQATIPGKGTIKNVRFEARPQGIKRVGDWRWNDNPFRNTPEFRGLKVMMAFINNWDIKDSNNEILQVRNESTGANELRYIISDLGGSFGKTGGFFSRTRNKPEDFVEAKFIEAVKGNIVDFNYGGKMQSIFENITVDDARWLGNLLSRLSDQQIEDAFRAANHTPEEIRLLSGAVRARINALTQLSSSTATGR